MSDLTIRDYIRRELPAPEQETALAFIGFLEENQMTFYKDNGNFWKDKIYYWVQLQNECVWFIEIKALTDAEAGHHWTVWSDDIGSDWMEKADADDSIRETAWRYADHCGHCGSCQGGRPKVIFGRKFDDICGCTFAVENPSADDLPFLHRITQIRSAEIRNGAGASSANGFTAADGRTNEFLL